MKSFSSVLLGCGLLLATSMGTGGCGGLSKPYPAKQLYAIGVERPQPAPASTPSSTLRVLGVRVADPFSSREFHYRVAPNQFQQDYYATFVADPDRLLTGEIIEWMSATGQYASVVDASSPVKSDRSLQCVVTELYGDMSEPGVSPRAVIAARFFILDESEVEAKVLFSRDYRQVEPTRGSGADNLAQAWGRAMKRILEQLTTDLKSVRASAAPT